MAEVAAEPAVEAPAAPAPAAPEEPAPKPSGPVSVLILIFNLILIFILIKF